MNSRGHCRPSDGYDIGQGPVVTQEVEVYRSQTVERSAFVARDCHRFQENFRQDDRGTAVQVNAILEIRDTRVTKYLKSRRLASPIAAPEACGCMWMMSVPIAT